MPFNPFNIVHKRRYWYIISAILIIPGLISLFFQGLNLGIHFTGGNITEIRVDQSVTTAQVREVVRNQELTDRYIQESTDGVFLIRTEVLTEQETNALLAALDEELGGMTLLRSDKVGPTIGAEIARNALIALAIAAVLMMLYIAWRFEFTKGLATIATIVHDVLVTVGIISLLQLEVDSAFVAAVLTIVGYTINATIIIFDRIRENMVLKRGMKVDQVINISVWQTLNRTVNTSLTVLFVLVPLFIFGGTTLKGFALALIIGVTAGAYSSMFLAGTLWYDIIGERRRKRLVRGEQS
ncbi:protein translocase subunit SecF [Desulfofalx alkaliphila]|uniref:protein translocase subunit SecF n=1 Tax=Desulfofalx alkaliphila TaxID=105483 RepID=UPI0004E1D3CE|nr:protein translocase subunit SecF [Desulfofalx alkaliphila]